jgi:steroid 5-alpha reductase family enzyme
VSLVLGPYWVAPFLLISGVVGKLGPASGPLIAGCISLYAVGVVLMMAADAQKHFTLKYKRGLIDEGLFARVRHTNYLGEMMIYASFALMVPHWIPWAILAFVWIVLFGKNILMKELSLSRYPGWADYKKRSGILWPF